MNEFGFWSNNKWTWNILLRRRLFGWEINQWEVLCTTLKEFGISESLKDSLIWKGTPSGRYSANQFCKDVIKSKSSNSKWWKIVWSGLAPPKVEVFCWQLMRGRIAVKEQLARRGLVDWNIAVCTFCKAEIESVVHLFFACRFSWLIWMHYCSIWDLSWVFHIESVAFLLAWQEALPVNSGNELWKMAFFAIIWSIWLMRNEMVFNGKVFDLRQILDIINLKIANWFKAKWPKCTNSILDIVRFPNIIKRPPVIKAVKRGVSWNPPFRLFEIQR